MIVYSLCLILSSQLTAAFACTAPPRSVYWTVDEIVEQSEWIALATVDLSELIPPQQRGFDHVIYHMRTIEALRGDPGQTFKVRGRQLRPLSQEPLKPSDTNFFGHAVSSFWTGAGRELNYPDCDINPAFALDRTYLIFGPVSSSRGFEMVGVQGDAWLAYVRRKLAGEPISLPFPKPVDQYFGEAKAILHVSVKWNADAGASRWTRKLLKGPPADYLRIAHVSPQEQFDNMLVPNCVSNGFRSLSHAKQPAGERPRSVELLYVFERLPEIPVRVKQYETCLGNITLQGFGNFTNNGVRIFPVQDGLVQFGTTRENQPRVVIPPQVAIADIPEIIKQ